MKKNNLFILLAVVIVFGIFLRVYKINTNYYFTGELGKELLYTNTFSVLNRLPLKGMPTSHEWLSYGPLYYWILMPIYKIYNGNPFILFWLALIVSIIGLVLNYYIFKDIFNKKVAYISTLIQAISPLMIWQTRLSKLHVFFWILIPLFTFYLKKLWDGEKKYLFLGGLIYGIMFSFHFSQIPLLVVPLILFYLKRNIYIVKDFFIFSFGIIIPNITLIFDDRNLLLWLPYRVVTGSSKDFGGTLKAFNEFFGKLIFWDQKYWLIGTLAILFWLIYYLYQNYRKIKKDFGTFYVITTICVTLVANALHGSPPVHYFLPIFTIVPILMALYFEKHIKHLIILIPILLLNLITFKSDALFYKNLTQTDYSIDLVPFSIQNALTNYIVADSKGAEFSLKRIGPYDYFPENYSQNYKYLIINKGGKLVDSSKNTYTIVEDEKTGGVYVQK